MNPHRISILWRAALLLCLSAQAGAHEGDRVYPIAYLTDEMVEHIRVDDGSVDEWHELVGEPSLTILDCSGQIQERAIRPVRPRLPNLAGLARRPGSFPMWPSWPAMTCIKTPTTMPVPTLPIPAFWCKTASPWRLMEITEGVRAAWIACRKRRGRKPLGRIRLTGEWPSRLDPSAKGGRHETVFSGLHTSRSVAFRLF